MRTATMVIPLVILLALGFASAPAPATPPQPSYGVAVVDGNPGEWNLNVDFFANMYRAGDPEKPLESKLYLRYDCLTYTVYALVLVESGVAGTIDTTATTAWIAIDDHNHKAVNEVSGNDGVPPDFAWVGQGYDGDPLHVMGYEASFPLEPGMYLIIAHLWVTDGGAQTSATIGFPKTGPPLVLNCETPAEPATWSHVKALYR